MSIEITDERMTSDQTWHWAFPKVAGEPYGEWAVTWLRDRCITRNQAITAMTLAETVASLQEKGGTAVVDHTHRMWPFIDGWAAELGLTGPDAVVRLSEVQK